MKGRIQGMHTLCPNRTPRRPSFRLLPLFYTINGHPGFHVYHLYCCILLRMRQWNSSKHGRLSLTGAFYFEMMYNNGAYHWTPISGHLYSEGIHCVPSPFYFFPLLPWSNRFAGLVVAVRKGPSDQCLTCAFPRARKRNINEEEMFCAISFCTNLVEYGKLLCPYSTLYRGRRRNSLLGVHKCLIG